MRKNLVKTVHTYIHRAYIHAMHAYIDTYIYLYTNMRT